MSKREIVLPPQPTDEEIELFAAQALREKKLRGWAGFRDDGTDPDGPHYTIPVISQSVGDLVRACLAAVEADREAGRSAPVAFADARELARMHDSWLLRIDAWRENPLGVLQPLYAGSAPVVEPLDADDRAFLQFILKNPGAKHDTYEYPDPPAEQRWTRFEREGLIECVGSWKWKPRDEAKLLQRLAAHATSSAAPSEPPAHTCVSGNRDALGAVCSMCASEDAASEPPAQRTAVASGVELPSDARINQLADEAYHWAAAMTLADTNTGLKEFRAKHRAAIEGLRNTALSTASTAPHRHYPLPDDLYAGSKDWVAGDYPARVEWLHTMYESRKADVERMEASTVPAPASPDLNRCQTCGRLDLASLSAAFANADESVDYAGKSTISPAQPASPDVAKMVAEARQQAFEQAARACEKLAEQRFDDHGIREPDTGACYYGGRVEEEYYARDEEDDECAKVIRALGAATTQARPDIPLSCRDSHEASLKYVEGYTAGQAATQAKASVSAEWISVPREPTEAMTRAGHEAIENEFSLHKAYCKLWNAMVSAAPQPPKDRHGHH